MAMDMRMSSENVAFNLDLMNLITKYNIVGIGFIDHAISLWGYNSTRVSGTSIPLAHLCSYSFCFCFSRTLTYTG